MITDIRLQNFRSYNDASFGIAPNVNIIVGPNASGKTNLLEAVLVLARGSSYKAKDAELIGFGSDWARLDADTPFGARVAKIVNDSRGTTKTFEIEDQVVTRLHQTRTIPVVLFEPNHLLLLSGSPDLRRTLLDDLIEQTQAGYGSVRRHYRRVLAQRNALLKRNPRDLAEQLFVWNVRLSELGGKLVHERQALTNRFAQCINEVYGSLSTRANTVELSYSTQFPVDNYETALLHKLESNLDLDIIRGFTASGPHRDDLRMTIDGHDVAESASRGETRTMVLALKVLELQLLESVRTEKPLLLLDDVFSELDIMRRQALTRFVAGYQTFITTTDADVVVHHFTSSNIIPLATQG